MKPPAGTLLRIGLIGTSGYAELAHVATVRSHSGAKLQAICGRNRDRAAELAARYSIPQVHTDYHDLVASRDVDAVIVAAPDDLHHEMTMAALAAGKHVVCEKPLARTVEQAQQMLDAATAAGVTHMTHFSYRWLPELRAVKRFIDDGRLGECLQAHFVFYMGTGASEAPYTWRYDPGHGFGRFGDVGAHLIDMARWTVGEIAAVSASFRTFTARPPAAGWAASSENDSAVALVEFASGSHGSIAAGAAAPGRFWAEIGARLIGRRGTLVVDVPLIAVRDPKQHVPPVCQWFPADSTVVETLDVGHDVSDPGHLFGEFRTGSAGDRAFVDAVLAGAQVEPSFLDGLRAQQVIAAGYASVAERRWVDVAGG